MILGLAAAIDFDRLRHRIAVAAFVVSARASARERQQQRRDGDSHWMAPAMKGNGPSGNVHPASRRLFEVLLKRELAGASTLRCPCLIDQLLPTAARKKRRSRSRSRHAGDFPVRHDQRQLPRGRIEDCERAGFADNALVRKQDVFRTVMLPNCLARRDGSRPRPAVDPTRVCADRD